MVDTSLAIGVHILVAMLFITGIVCTILPIVPGNLVVWLGVLLHKVLLPLESVGWRFFVVATVITALALIIDGVASWLGAKKFGASREGAIGAVLGGILGAMFFLLPGAIIGPVVGAVFGEMINRRPRHEIERAGLGTFLGGMIALLAKVIGAVYVVAGFYWAIT